MGIITFCLLSFITAFFISYPIIVTLGMTGYLAIMFYVGIFMAAGSIFLIEANISLS